MQSLRRNCNNKMSCMVAVKEDRGKGQDRERTQGWRRVSAPEDERESLTEDRPLSHTGKYWQEVTRSLVLSVVPEPVASAYLETCWEGTFSDSNIGD